MFETVQKNLEAHGYRTRVFSNGGEAAAYLDQQIDGVKVGFGGSATLQALGLYDTLAKHNDTHWHWKGGPEERYHAMDAEVYLSSVNAIAETGEIVNIDGTGNRVAATLFGPKRLYLIIGRNKLTPDLESALWRARNIAAPKNAMRLGMKTPCAVKGDHCYDCDSPDRICRGLTILWRPMMGMETHIILIDADLGL